jgi:hypothetical protein
VSGRTITKPKSAFRKSSGDEAGVRAGIVVSKLQARLGTLHQQIKMLPADRPERWQALLQDYLVTASALYKAQNPE